MKTALIISGGEFDTFYPSIEYDLIIACDKGYEYAKELKITPDVILGDFDSINPDNIPRDEANLNSYTLADTSSSKPVIIKYPVEKDDTDTLLAIKYAIKNNCTHIIIICALGGRIDHTMANIQSLHYAATKNVLCEIYSSKEHLYTKKGPATFSISSKPSFSLSLYSLTDICKGLTIKGAKYEVNEYTLTNFFPIAYGNTINDTAVISIREGILLIVESIVN